MGTLNNRRFINLVPVAIGKAKTFWKCTRSLVQVFNGKEKQPRTPGYTINLSGEFVPSGKIRKIKRARRSLALKTAQSTMKTKTMWSFLGLKPIVIGSKLSFKALTTLFDSLIKPIVLVCYMEHKLS